MNREISKSNQARVAFGINEFPGALCNEMDRSTYVLGRESGLSDGIVASRGGEGRQ